MKESTKTQRHFQPYYAEKKLHTRNNNGVPVVLYQHA